MQIYSGRKPIVVGGQQQFHLPCTSSKKTLELLTNCWRGLAWLGLENCYGITQEKPKVSK